VLRYQAGETQLFGFFVGQVKKALSGTGDPAAIADELKKHLN
jgi:aspartyl-tRNA(Asn)/glutamyl-tRNA(Gln) amidotransferase subunit B